MSATKNHPDFDRQLEDAEAARKRWEDEMHQWWELEQENPFLPEPSQRFVLQDGEVIE